MIKKNFFKLLSIVLVLFTAVILTTASLQAAVPDVDFNNAVSFKWDDGGTSDYWNLVVFEIDGFPKNVPAIAEYTNPTDMHKIVAYNSVNAIYTGHTESYLYWVFDGVNEVVDFYNYKFHKKETVVYADLVDVKRYDNPAGDVPSPKYLIRFYVDGNLYESQNVQVGFTVDLPEIPVKDDFTFVNWYLDPNLYYVFDEETQVEYSFDLYAKWQKNNVQVKFFNGDELYETKDVFIGNRIDSFPVTPDILDYAKLIYDSDIENAEYNSNSKIFKMGGFEWNLFSSGSLSSDNIVLNCDNEIISREPFSSLSKVELIFSNTSSDSSRINCVVYISKDLENWTKFIDVSNNNNPGKVTRVINVHSTGPNYIKITSSSLLTNLKIYSIKFYDSPKSRTDDDYVFDGWYYDKEYQNPYNVNDIITADTDVYSKWKIVEHNIDFEVDNEVYESFIFNPAKDEFVLPESPVKTGYQFGGWFYEDEFLIPFDEEAEIDSDMTLYAKWELLKFNIDFYLAEELYHNILYDIETDFILPSTPIPENEEHVFLGWYYDEDFETKFKITDEIDSDLILYGKFGLAGSGGTDLPDDDSSRLTFKKEYILYTFLGIVAILVIAGLFKPKKRKRR